MSSMVGGKIGTLTRRRDRVVVVFNVVVVVIILFIFIFWSLLDNLTRQVCFLIG